MYQVHEVIKAKLHTSFRNLFFKCSVVSNSLHLMDCSPPGSSIYIILQARILEWATHSLLQGIFPTQGSNPGLLHCRWILYQLSYQEMIFKRNKVFVCRTRMNIQDWFLCSPRDSQESSPTPQFKSTSSSVLSLLHSPTLTSIHDHWKNHSLD